MPYVPHSKNDIKEMLDEIGVSDLADLFDEVPGSIPKANIASLDVGMSEQELKKMFMTAAPYKAMQCYIGAGAYEHSIPAMVWDLLSRGEFLTAYTPYQAEASQGTLEMMFQFQSLMSKLTAMDVCNASVYDAATALAEAILMAARILALPTVQVGMPRNLHPHYRQVVKTILSDSPIELVEINYDPATGLIEKDSLDANPDLKILVVAQPNFFGGCDDADYYTDYIHARDGLLIACVNPMSLGLLQPPGKWGDSGADIVCGDVQPFAIPLAMGGPYCGFLCCKKSLIRQLPGRLVARTIDSDGQTGYTLTLQAREQHIRREKARSNICTNQGLLMSAAVIYMRYHGGAGLYEIAKRCNASSVALQQELAKLPGVCQVFASNNFHEFVLRFERNVYDVADKLRDYNIQAGYPLCVHYPELGNALLVCITETKSKSDLTNYINSLRVCLQEVNDA